MIPIRTAVLLAATIGLAGLIAGYLLAILMVASAQSEDRPPSTPDQEKPA